MGKLSVLLMAAVIGVAVPMYEFTRPLPHPVAPVEMGYVGKVYSAPHVMFLPAKVTPESTALAMSLVKTAMVNPDRAAAQANAAMDKRVVSFVRKDDRLLVVWTHDELWGLENLTHPEMPISFTHRDFLIASPSSAPSTR